MVFIRVILPQGDPNPSCPFKGGDKSAARQLLIPKRQREAAAVGERADVGTDIYDVVTLEFESIIHEGGGCPNDGSNGSTAMYHGAIMQAIP